MNRVTPVIDVDAIIRRVRPYSMAMDADIRFTCEQTLAAIDQDRPGVIVECGVWRGGTIAAVLLAQLEAYGEIRRPALLLDSFEGLPPATPRDGPAALAYQIDTNSPAYYDNCRAGQHEVAGALRGLGLPDHAYELIPGWFEQTVPALSDRLRQTGIAMLRLDADWYDSTRVCLEHLVTLVSDESVIVIDDYYHWDGCARAVHDFLSEHDLAYRVRNIPDGGFGANMTKRPARI